MISRTTASMALLGSLCCLAALPSSIPTATAQPSMVSDCSGGIHETSYAFGFPPSLMPWSEAVYLPKVELGPGESLVAVEIESYFDVDMQVFVQNLSRENVCFAEVFGDTIHSVDIPEANFSMLNQQVFFDAVKLPPGLGQKLQLTPDPYFSSTLLTEGHPGFENFVAGSPGEGMDLIVAADVFFNFDSTCENVAFSFFAEAAMEVEVRYTICTEVFECPTADPVELWPPNHQYHAIDLNELLGDEDGSYGLVITSITQDEPINGTGDGNTTCDGTGVGSAVAMLRAERKGDGDGRVYAVSYSATTPDGLVCDGVLMVSVPHSQNGDPAVDSGQDYDSSEGCGD